MRCREASVAWHERSTTSIRSRIAILLSANLEHNETRVLYGLCRGVSMDLDECNKLVQAVQAGERRYHTLIREMLHGFALHEVVLDEQDDPIDYRFLEINPAFEKLTGLTAANAVGRSVREVLPQIDEFWMETYGHVALRRQPAHFEKFSANRQRYFEVHAFSPCEMQFAVIISDITERKRLEEEKNVQLDFLRLVNEDTDLEGMVDTVLTFLQKWTRIDGLGIRLRQDGDFTYFRSRGLPTEFKREDRQLCELDGERPERDALRPPSFPSCLCRRVLEDRLDPAAPTTSPKGSFWTNHLSRLLTDPSRSGLAAGACRRCLDAGFESVMLVPLKVRGAIQGLLQFYHGATGRFTSNFVDLVERLADYIAVAFAQRLSEERLKVKQAELEETNAALNVLIRNREKEFQEHDRSLSLNLHRLILPSIERMKLGPLSDRQKAQLNILENNLHNLTSPFAKRLESSRQSLPPALHQVADLIKQGFTSKEIAGLMGVSMQTVETYRKRIRAKLDLQHSKVNLRAYLMSLE